MCYEVHYNKQSVCLSIQLPCVYLPSHLRHVSLVIKLTISDLK